MSRFVPPAKRSEFFGFFAFSGKITSFLGPILLGIATQMFSSQRIWRRHRHYLFYHRRHSFVASG